MSNSQSIDLYDNNKHQSLYISDYIKFADGKAGFTFGAATILFGFFVNEWKKEWPKNVTFEALKDWTFSSYLSGLILFALGIYFLVFTVWPRYLIKEALYQSWGGISAYKKPNDYASTVKSKVVNANLFLDDMLRQNHALAMVCRRKFTNLRRAYWLLALALVITGGTWIIN